MAGVMAPALLVTIGGAALLRLFTLL
jgi:hypothetical protein